MRGFASRAFEFKMIADYEPWASIPPAEADARFAIETAGRFIEDVVRLIGLPTSARDTANKPRP